MVQATREKKGRKQSEIGDVEASTEIYVMKGEFYPKPQALRGVKPTVAAVDAKAEIVRKFGASLLGVKKSGVRLGVSSIAGGLHRIVRGLR